MNKNYLAIGAAGVLAGALCFLGAAGSARRPGQEILDTATVVSSAARGPASLAAPVAIAPVAAPGSPLANRPLSEEEKESVKTYLRLLAGYQDLKSAKELVQELKSAKLNPVLARDSNKDTGELAMVRTEDTLPGTRYFHAQVFEDGKGLSHAQHLSFEVRPGKDSMETATSLIKQAYRELGTPILQQEDYVMWRNRDGRIISARRLDADGLKDNYFNAHSPEDVGTIWITSEDDPEQGEES